ncbi:MAG: polysaccharide deacetylase family protein, partial [Ginsengibacter sp.]
QDHLGISYSITTNEKEFEEFTQEKLNFSTLRIENSFFIRSANLIFENNIYPQKIPVGHLDSHKVLFPHLDCDLGFDIFSASFYLSSRYEEYLDFTPDEFGRFKAFDSLAYKNDFLELPIVDIWVMYFKKKLIEKFPRIQCSSNNHFKAILTYDIDIAYKFKGRNLMRNAGSTFKDLLQKKIKNIEQRISVLLKLKKDNWDIYDELQHTIQKNKISSVFFFLVGNPSTYDRNLRAESPLMRQLIKRIATFGEIGIHPSFSSNQNKTLLKLEKERLENIVNRKITKNRQHFLKLKFPDTYSNLIALGIKEDYTMGFPEMPGFRAGTCTPFYFYDLQKEQKANLLIFPTSCMEASFKYYLKSSPENSILTIKNIIDSVQKVNGTFISIWHNDNLEDTQLDKDWRWCHKEMIQYLQSFKY